MDQVLPLYWLSLLTIENCPFDLGKTYLLSYLVSKLRENDDNIIYVHYFGLHTSCQISTDLREYILYTCQILIDELELDSARILPMKFKLAPLHAQDLPNLKEIFGLVLTAIEVYLSKNSKKLYFLLDDFHKISSNALLYKLLVLLQVII